MRPLALVTGGWRRIGAAIARTLAGAGWDLALHAHAPASFDAAFRAELEALGAAVYPLSADLADAQAAMGLVGEAQRAAGRVPSLLVNSAARFHDDTVLTLGLAELEQHFRTNLFAPVLLARAMAEALRQDEGSVVHILDQRVRNPVPDQLSYTLSKQALHASVRTLARALAPRIRVNGVAPGLTLPTDEYGSDQWRRLEGVMPLKRLSSADGVADAVLYLAQAREVTGQTIFVDAGAHLESYPRDFLYLER